ncbi:hypothetical protein TNCV_2697291 [Trichonephila clavipes]|nr:hypothetical protein TNCV_2697291 [Trichonephila clavipes]
MQKDSTNTRRTERKARAGMANNAAEHQSYTGRKQTTGPQGGRKGRTGDYQSRRENVGMSNAGVKIERSLQGKLTDGTVVEIEAGASFYTDPSSDNVWRRGTEANIREAQKMGRGGATRGGKANQDATWAEPNTKMGEMVRTTNDTDESGRKQELQKRRKWNRNKTSSMVHSSRVLDI